MKEEIKEISLRELLDTEFTINDKMEMVGTFTLDRINMISDILNNLQEENENLKDYLKIMEKGKDNNLNRFLDYKQRNEKAIEYIKENATYDEEYKVFCDDLRYDDCLDLLNILKGDKDE